jgi:hypothetical protein
MARLRFHRHTSGASAVEMALLAPIFFIGLLSMFDLGAFFWRWNQEVEAARVGARIAAVSNPVSSDISSMTGLETGVIAGAPAGAYERVCSPSACTNGVYDAAAMSRIVYGPGSASCNDAATREKWGVCDVLPTVLPAHVRVAYRSSGVDTAGVEGGLRPLVSVRIAGAPSRVVLIDRLFPGLFAALPATEATVLAEDLRTAA